MPTTPRSLLVQLLRFDALLCAGMGLLLVLAAGLLGDLLDLPQSLLRGVGAGLLPWALLVWWLAQRAERAPRRAWVVIAGNALWVIASVVLLLSTWVEPSVTGSAFLALQAMLVAALALMQTQALRRPATVYQPTIT